MHITEPRKIYRPDIDGLRAIAILAVIFFHAGFSVFPGGFVGVDIFFVISGYLITRIIVSEKEAGIFSFTRFYERRIRRIIPALLGVLLGVLVLGYFMFSPLDYRSAALASFAALLFLGNVTSYQQTNYFESAAELNPTLHLWSLGIEEQYYLIAPLLLLFLLARRKIFTYSALAIAVSFSIYWGENLLNINSRAAFYFLPSRFWELLIGAMAGMATLDQFVSPRLNAISESKWGSLVRFCGLSLILFPIFFYSRQTDFPGISAIPPTFGIALLLVFNSRNGLVYRILTKRPLIWVGLISYSAYLWHQPIFAFYRYQSINEITVWEKGALTIATLAAAYLSYRFIETPYRHKRNLSFSRVKFHLGISALAIAAACVYVYLSKGVPQRFDGKYSQALLPHKIREGDLCDFKSIPGVENIESCTFGADNGNRTIYLFGDSHASVLIGGLNNEFKKAHITGHRVKINGCAHFIPGMIAGEPSSARVNQAIDCKRSFDNLLKYMSETRADAIIVNVRWASRFSPIPGRITSFAFDNGQGGVELKPEKPSFALDGNNNWVQIESAKHAALSEFITKLASASPALFVVYPTPEPGWDLPKYNFSHYLKSGNIPKDITVSYAIFNKRQSFVKDVFDGIDHPSIIRISPERHMCEPDNGLCYLQKGHAAYFYDTNHLSFVGAEPLVFDIMKGLSRK